MCCLVSKRVPKSHMHLLQLTRRHVSHHIYIKASLSKPHHVRSTVKSVFLLACVLVMDPYMVALLFMHNYIALLLV